MLVEIPLREVFLPVTNSARRTAGDIRRGGAKTDRVVEHRARTSDRVRAIPDQRAGTQFDLGALGAGAGISLVPGLPAVDEFPIDIWERLRSQVLAQKGTHLLRHASSRGDADPRKPIPT